MNPISQLAVMMIFRCFSP